MNLNTLLYKYLHNELTDSEKEILRRKLQSDPEAAKRLFKMAAEEKMVHDAADQVFKSEQKEKTIQRGISSRRKKSKKEELEPIKLPWYAQVRYVAMLTVGVLIATYFINEYQYSQTEDLIRLRLKEFYGKVEVERSRKVIPAQKNMELRNNDRIRTDENASAVMEYTGEATRVEISKDTDVRIREDKGQKLFDLDNGRVDLSVDKQPQGAGLRVTTPHAQVDVLGTIFSVDVSEAYEAKTNPGGKGKPSDSEISDLKSEIPRTRVETYEGRVQVTRKADKTSLMLDAGQHLCVTDSTDKKLAAADISGWAGIRRGLNDEILRQYKWTFEDGVPNDLILLGKADCKNKKLIASKGLKLILPVELRTVPVLVTGRIGYCNPSKTFISHVAYIEVKTSENELVYETPEAKGYVYDLRSLHPFSRNLMHKAILQGRYIICLNLGQVHALKEYKYAEKKVGVVYENVVIKSIELEEKALSEIPRKYRIIEGVDNLRAKMKERKALRLPFKEKEN